MIAPVMIMDLPGSVNGYAYQKLMLSEELAPLVIDQGTVCLKSIYDAPSGSIVFLVFNSGLVKFQSGKHGFTSLPHK